MSDSSIFPVRTMVTNRPIEIAMTLRNHSINNSHSHFMDKILPIREGKDGRQDDLARCLGFQIPYHRKRKDYN